MSNNILRPLRRLFTGIGGSLPGLSSLHHGVIAIKRAASTEDEVHIGLRDSSNVMQWRRMLTKTYADTLYGGPLTVQEGGATTDATVTTLSFDASDFNLTESPEDTVSIALAYGTSAGTPAEGNHTHAAVLFNGIGTFPQGASQSNDTLDTAYNSGWSHCLYMGRADAAYTNISIFVEVEVAAATITWAEVGVGTSDDPPAFGADMDITRRGYTDVSASFNSTGEKTVSITVSGISPGDHLWALIGSQATTPYQTIRVNHNEANGTWGAIGSTRISTMASPTTFADQSSTVSASWGYWIGS